MIARFDRRDLGADLFDDPGPFVAADHRIRHRKIACHQVVVAVAEAGRRQAHPHLVRARRVEIHLLHLELLVLPMEHGCPSLHETPFVDLITSILIRASTPAAQTVVSIAGPRRPCRC